jgi:aminomethyltransferase
MPLHYGSQLAEHHAVRQGAGMFDVSHMTVIDVSGAGGAAFLRAWWPTTSPLDSAGQGALRRAAERRRRRHRRPDRLSARARLPGGGECRHPGQGAGLAADAQRRGRRDGRAALAMLAVQGPEAIARFETASGWRDVADIAPFTPRAGGWMVARTGYTGEDGIEVILPGDAAVSLWQRTARGRRRARRARRPRHAAPRGRAEPLRPGHGRVGQPAGANLAWTVAWKPETGDFIGRAALERQRAAGRRRLTGLVLEDAACCATARGW